MKLSKETIRILHNFQTINPSIVLREGKTIRTTRTDVIFARATVPDDFPRTIPIYDLSKFLGLLSLGKDDSDVDFGENYMTICQGSYEVKYGYAPEEIIDQPPPGKDIRIPSKDVQFRLGDDVWNQVSKAMNIMGFSEFAFVGEKGNLSIQALSVKNDSSDTYSAHLGTTDKEFRCILTAANMKLIPSDYDVTISKRGLVHFAGENVDYWIVSSAKSSFED